MLNGATISSGDLWHVKRVSPQTIVCADRIFRPYPMSDLFGNGGRGLLASHQLPKAWQQTTLANVRLHDFVHVNFLVSFVFFLVAVTALTVIVRARSRHQPTSQRLFSIAVLAFSATILTLGLIPTKADNELQLVPLVHLIGGFTPPIEGEFLLNAVGNVLLFMPFGAALCLRGLPLRKTVRSGIAISVVVEITQLLIPGRTTSVDDVLLNTLGALLGHALVSRWAPAPWPCQHKDRGHRRRPARRCRSRLIAQNEHEHAGNGEAEGGGRNRHSPTTARRPD
jgi:glycopeptide antibiotics resistance protein